MKNDRVKSAVFAVLAALVWGFAFAFQRQSAQLLRAFTFNFFRGVLATAALAVLVLVRRQPVCPPERRRSFWRGGAACGVLLFAAINLQQFGLEGTEASTAGFLTALYIVLVPLIEVVLLRRRVPLLLWISVLGAMAGLYLISVGEGFTIRRSDIWVILCAVAFAAQILTLDRAVVGVDPVGLCCVQSGVAALLSGICAFLFEHPSWRDAIPCLTAILYVGVVSGGLGYAFQTIAQKYGDPVLVTLITSTESLFSVLGAAVLLGEKLSPREAVGCAVMFAAVLLSQWPHGRRDRGVKT